MFDKVKNSFKMLYLKRKNPTCIFEKKSLANLNSSFEGYNKICFNCDVLNSHFGKFSYIGHDTDIKNTRIGRYTSIGPYVKTIIGSHPLDFVSTHPVFFSKLKQVGITYVEKQKFNEFKYAETDNRYSITIGNDVWIGANATILEGISVGDGAIIAAGAVVTKNVPPFAIVGGVPSKVIRYRFEKDNIRFLMDLKWWDKDEEWIKKHAESFDDIEKLKKELNG